LNHKGREGHEEMLALCAPFETRRELKGTISVFVAFVSLVVNLFSHDTYIDPATLRGFVAAQSPS